jgi:hypothetical protein
MLADAERDAHDDLIIRSGWGDWNEIAHSAATFVPSGVNDHDGPIPISSARLTTAIPLKFTRIIRFIFDRGAAPPLGRKMRAVTSF